MEIYAVRIHHAIRNDLKICLVVCMYQVMTKLSCDLQGLSNSLQSAFKMPIVSVLLAEGGFIYYVTQKIEVINTAGFLVVSSNPVCVQLAFISSKRNTILNMHLHSCC